MQLRSSAFALLSVFGVALLAGGCSSHVDADDDGDTAAVVASGADESYPRLATYLIETYVSPELEESMRKTDLTVLDV